MAYLNHNTPAITCYIRNEYLYNHEKGLGEFTACNIHSVASIQSRTPLFECLLENGANWTRRPIHAFCWKKDAPVLSLRHHIYWDCFSPYIDVSIRARLAGLRATLIDFEGKKHEGVNLFTLDWGWENKAGITDVGFSETPEHKCGHLFKMDDGNLFIYPNNRIVWYDAAWTVNRLKGNPGWQIDQSVYSVEGSVPLETDDSYMTQFKPAD
jgi:hypothetical protein